MDGIPSKLSFGLTRGTADGWVVVQCVTTLAASRLKVYYFVVPTIASENNSNINIVAPTSGFSRQYLDLNGSRVCVRWMEIEFVFVLQARID